MRARLRACLLIAGLTLTALAVAQPGRLTASVDRPSIRVNESFTYILRVEGSLAGQPDLSALAADFDIVQTRSSQSIQIVGGRTSQVAEWTVELMPRREGRFEMPPVELGGVRSNGVVIEVQPAAVSSSETADIFIEAELDRDQGYVQAQAIYTLRLFVGIATGREVLTAPRIAGGEAIVEKLGSDREFQTVRAERLYRVRERKYAIFPQSAGTLTIGPAVYEATVIPSRGFSRQQRLSSEILSFDVLPAVAPPASHPDAVWLPAANLTISQEFSDGGRSFEQGVPRTRTLTIVADGLLETQLPELRIAAADGLRQYPDQPELTRQLKDDGIEARRRERFAIIAENPGTVDIPPVELPWWNIDAGRWEVARVEPASINVLPGVEPTAPPVRDAAAAAAPAPAPTPGIWPLVSALLALGWLGTVLAWFAVGRLRPGRKDRQSAAARPTSGRSLLKQLDAACRVHDGKRVQELLLQWARLQYADRPPGSLGALAGRLSGPLAAEIEALEASLYGPRARDWRGDALLAALRKTQSVARRQADEDQDPLVPLYR